MCEVEIYPRSVCVRTAPGNVNMVAYGKINTRLSPCFSLKQLRNTSRLRRALFKLRQPRKKGYQRRNTSYKTKENCQSPWFEKTDLNFRQINTVIEVLPIIQWLCLHTLWCCITGIVLKCCYHRALIILVRVCRSFLVYFCALVSDIWS